MTPKNIVLVGFMGTGKSSVGKILAKKLGRRFVDVDAWIEDSERTKIRDIFESRGEAAFRVLEKAAIAHFSAEEGLVLTTGGGAVLDPDNLAALRTNGVIVALMATPETVYQRVRHSRHRPLLNGEDMFSEIRRLMEIRRPHYEGADLRFDTDGCTAAQVAVMIAGALENKS